MKRSSPTSTTDVTAHITAILHYWIGDAANDPVAAHSRKKLWYGGGSQIDQEISERFGHLLQAVASTVSSQWNASPWQESAAGVLAAVILLDQFPRNIYRGKSAAFQYDALTLEMVQGLKDDHRLTLLERGILYHPYQHAESEAAQETSVRRYEALANSAPEAWQPMMQSFLNSAIQHRNIIQKFGRFPHRNAVLGRDNTPEEDAFLASGGATFGQGKPK